MPPTVSGILHNLRYTGLSTYTPKEQLADGNRRRAWKAQIPREDEGRPIRGIGRRWSTRRCGERRRPSPTTSSGD